MKNLWQFIKFGLVGISNTLISEGLYCLFVFFGMHYLPAYFLGFTISVFNAYYWNNRYVFKNESEQKRVWWKVLLKTYVSYLAGFIISSVLLVFWIDIVQLSKYLSGIAEICAGCGFESLDAYFWSEIIAAGLNLLIVVPLNFLVNKFWAFKDHKKEI